MITSGKPLSIFTIKTEDIKGFQSEAKKYGVTYNVIKGKEACDIMCTADQSIQVKKAFENLNIGVLGDADVQPPSVSPLKEETLQKEKEETFVDDVLGVTKERADKSHIQAINQIVDDEPKKENPKQALKKDPQSKPLSEQKDTGKSKKDEKPSIRTEIQKMKQMQKVRTTDINRALNKQKNSIKL